MNAKRREHDDADYLVVDEVNGIVVLRTQDTEQLEKVGLRYRQVHGHAVGIYAKVGIITDEHMEAAAKRAADDALAAHEAERKRVSDWNEAERKRQAAIASAADAKVDAD